MKHSDNTEMDRLLRRYARQQGETLRAERAERSDSEAGASLGAHLDPDEMNAYAEDVLPEAMRSRYFAHLGDCNACRKLVTDLTLAASRVNEERLRTDSLKITPSKSWREWLTAIFSPAALRYGVPALALFAIVIVALVAMRTQRREASVAMNNEESGYSSPSAGTASNSAADPLTRSGTAANHSNSNAAPVPEQQNTSQRGIVAEPTPVGTAQEEADKPAVSQETVATPSTSKAGDLKDSPRDLGEGGKREQVAAAPPANMPVLAAPDAAPQIRERQEEQKKAKASGKDDDENIASGTAAGGAIAGTAPANEDRRDKGRTNTARSAQAAPRARRTAPAKNDTSSDMVEKESSGETRSIGGRRFQRQGSSWVDTAFVASRQLTNVRRGSEQYRALVADEPGLRSIAEQLSGEVIVVWKSRAYRFY